MTNSITLQLSDDYRLHLHTQHVNATNGVFFGIDSQWLGAKHPADTQRQFGVQLNREQVRQVINLLEQA